jgi:hypothetical protein
MAIPIRSFPVLEGEVARRFEREARKAERERGTIKMSQEAIDSCNRIMDDYRQRMRNAKN